jgi:hypothetical protein
VARRTLVPERRAVVHVVPRGNGAPAIGEPA